jgi:hypothetical protein
MRGAVGTLDPRRDSMRTFVVAVAAATILAASSFVKPAAAITLGGADGLRHAIEDTDLVDKVHCRPGWPHHWNGGDGCHRYNYYPRYRYNHYPRYQYNRYSRYQYNHYPRYRSNHYRYNY